LLELFLKPDEHNLTEVEEEMVKNDRLYDLYIYLMIPVQYLAVGYFLYSLCDFSNSFAFNSELGPIDIAGRILSAGTLSAQSINIGHELGHRLKKYEKFLAKLALLVTLNMHFFIEHNRGHHNRVATPHDPATSRKGDILYLFWIRSTVLSAISAWKLEYVKLKRLKKPFISIYNEMILFAIAQISFVCVIYFFFGLYVTLAFVCAALIGKFILETINYIEHYGLKRTVNDDGKYERVQAHHSWNSNHVIGRIMIFELSRHSDHHYRATRKYQILKHHDNAPQMPTGYPGMMVLSLLPPLWFYVMNPLVDKVITEKH